MNKLLNNIIPYIKIARLDHYVKQLFILPGSLVAIILCHININDVSLINFIIGFFSTCLIASSNYVINEYLDIQYDKFHPTKKHRALIKLKDKIKLKYIIIEYLSLLTLGLALSLYISNFLFYANFLLAIMGIIYNVKPIRSKDIPYIDVLSESFNMAIRLLIGWFLIITTFFPPISLILGYWFAGAFLMSVKRFSEYNMINNPKQAGLYRKSFQYYSEEKLNIQSLFYAMLSVFFIGIFLIKYKIELLLIIPFLCTLYCYYFKLSFSKDSSTQRPEKLFHEKKLIIYIFLINILAIILLTIEIPALHILLDNSLIGIP
jgi:4-hydroxybenzoate polyprenyltransferase